MKRFCLSAFAVLALCAMADANGGCIVRNRVVVQHQQINHAAIVAVTPVVAAVFQPVAVVQSYGVGYADNGQQLQAENERLKLEIQLQQLKFQVQQLQANQQPAPVINPPVVTPPSLAKSNVAPPVPNANAEHPAIGIMRKNCASCHDNAVAKVKGGGFVLTDGALFAKLNDKQSLSIYRELYSGRMPKNSKLTDEEVGQIFDWLDQNK